MDELSRRARGGHAEPHRRRTADDQFPERLAASMQRHRRILDRLAGDAE